MSIFLQLLLCYLCLLACPLLIYPLMYVSHTVDICSSLRTAGAILTYLEPLLLLLSLFPALYRWELYCCMCSTGSSYQANHQA